MFQFAVMASPQPKEKKRQEGHGGNPAWKPRLWRPAKHKLGLAAVKHAQGLAEERAEQQQGQQGRAFAALAHVVADTGGGGWPESMTRELQACQSPEERNAWAVKWGLYLSGQAQRDKRGAPERPAASSSVFNQQNRM